MGKTWEVIPGRGASVLESLGRVARLHTTLGSPTEQLRAETAETNGVAEAIIERAAQAAIRDGVAIKPSSLFNRMMRAEQRSLAMAQIGNGILEVGLLNDEDYLEAELRKFTHLKARITPLVPNAVLWRLTSGKPSSIESESGLLEPGDTREGSLSQFEPLRSDPSVGGRLPLLIGRFFGSEVEVTGLVSPETGEPQIELDILAR